MEADPAHGRISNESPVGGALLGKRVGEGIDVHAPEASRCSRWWRSASFPRAGRPATPLPPCALQLLCAVCVVMRPARGGASFEGLRTGFDGLRANGGQARGLPLRPCIRRYSAVAGRAIRESPYDGFRMSPACSPSISFRVNGGQPRGLPYSEHRNPRSAVTERDTYFQVRAEKLERLREQGIAPFPARYGRDAYSGAGAGVAREVVGEGAAVGGKHGQRDGARYGGSEHGSRRVLDLRDVQAGCRRSFAATSSARDFELLKSLDLGDFLGVRGRLIHTRTGEPTVEARSVTMLGKALRPPPEKWHGCRTCSSGSGSARRTSSRTTRCGSGSCCAASWWRPSGGSWTGVTTLRWKRQSCWASRRGRTLGHSSRSTTRSAARLPSHRDGAVPQAVRHRRAGPGVRDRAHLPQRGPRRDAQPRVHDDGELRGLRGLP